ncbi:MAG: hypothetical protein ACYTFG_16355 [Planctomycetota bacterium]|jgi:hypothetical protein
MGKSQNTPVDNTPATEKAKAPKKIALPKAKPQNDCLCGCGAKVRGQFRQGHDQRVVGFLLRGIRDEEDGSRVLRVSEVQGANGEKSPFLTGKVVRELAARWQSKLAKYEIDRIVD